MVLVLILTLRLDPGSNITINVVAMHIKQIAVTIFIPDRSGTCGCTPFLLPLLSTTAFTNVTTSLRVSGLVMAGFTAAAAAAAAAVVDDHDVVVVVVIAVVRKILRITLQLHDSTLVVIA